MRERRQPPRRRITWQSILAILVLLALWLSPRIFLNTNGGGSGSYGQYQGPVLPMTVLTGGEELEGTRHVIFDFAPYETRVSAVRHAGEVIVTDVYRLKNPAAVEKTVTLAYPFESQFIDPIENVPAITVNGEAVQARLYPALDEGKAIFRAKDFDEYQRKMEETDYLAQAMEGAKAWDMPVKAYHFTDITWAPDPEDTDVFLTLDFAIPEGATVWTRFGDRVSSREDTHSVWFRQDREEMDLAWLFVVGGDLENLTFGGNRTHNVTENSALTDVEYQYEIVDTTFDALIWQFAQTYDSSVDLPERQDNGLITPEVLYGEFMNRLEESDFQENHRGVYLVDSLFYSSLSEIRLMYWVFPVTIPAGSGLEITAQYHQEASYDISGAKQYREGYDLATRLGSTLDFTDLSAEIQNHQWIEILRQNFGFDPEKGITQVILDPDTQRYYLEVRRSEA